MARSDHLCDRGLFIMPLVSVVVPTHNRPAFLAEALASVRTQTFTDYEIIVVSNGENAATRRASREVAAAHNSRYFAVDEGNLPFARNFGAEQANGSWIAFLDDDDLWLPSKLERQIAEGQRTGADMIFCDWAPFFPNGRETIMRPRLPDGWSYVKAFSHQHFWAVPSTVLVRKTALTKSGGFDVRLRFNEDNDLWRRISWHHEIHQVEEVLTRYRRGNPSAMRCPKFFSLRYYLKIRFDTPRDLRPALPSATDFILWRLNSTASERFRRLCSLLRPRTRWIAFRAWLAAGQTRIWS
jgi:glycosyltransferase involved in cell wall biosynthesis